jgi:hypothetical protein
MLGVAVALTADPPSLRAHFDAVYRLFRAPGEADDAAPDAQLALHLQGDANGESAALRVLHAGGGNAVDRGDPDMLCLRAAAHVYPLSPLPLVHAAVVARAGGALLLCASSGTGKTTLALALTRHGFDFLSDELAPLDLEGRTVLPFPRALGLRSGTLALLPWLAAGGRRGRNAKGEFKLFLDPADLPGVRLGGAAALRDVVFLAPPRDETERDAPRDQVLELTLDAPSREFEEALAGLAGIEQVRRLPERETCTIRLRVRPQGALSQRVEQLARAFGVAIVAARWGAHAAPRFESPPELARLGAGDGLLELARHLLNARGATRLLARYDGSVNRLLLALAGALAGARFWRLTVGELDAMASRLAEL